MTFLSTIEDLEKKLNEFQNLDQTQKEIREFQSNIGLLKDINDNLMFILNKKKLFKTKNINYEINNDQLNKIKINIIEVQKKFNLHETLEKLIEGRNLGNFKKFSDEFIKDYQNQIKQTWKQHCRSLYNGQSDIELEKIIVQTPDNSIILNNFKYEFEIFLNLQNKEDFEEEDFNIIEKTTKKLNQFRSQFVENHHEDVEIFLKKMNETGSVSIQFITDEVKKFIIENNFETTYLVKRENNGF